MFPSLSGKQQVSFLRGVGEDVVWGSLFDREVWLISVAGWLAFKTLVLLCCYVF